MYIEVAGNIASGKTTLAGIIGQTKDFVSCLEDFRSNPFWLPFYEAPDVHAFETEITFLLQHYHGIQRTLRSVGSTVVCDYAITLDRAYADVTLGDADRSVFSAVAERVVQKLDAESILVVLRCDERVLLERIHARGREVERQIHLEYLLRLSKSLDFQIESLRGSKMIIEIDSEHEDFAHESSTRKRIISLIRESLITGQL